jgi:hypothetical protein
MQMTALFQRLRNVHLETGLPIEKKFFRRIKAVIARHKKRRANQSDSYLVFSSYLSSKDDILFYNIQHVWYIPYQAETYSC